MKKTYFVKKDPSLPTGEDNWIMMNAYEFAMFMKTPEGMSRKKNFGQLDACDKGDSVYVFECGHETAKEWRADSDRHRYLLKCEKGSGFVTVSYDSISDDDSFPGEELLADENCNVEEDVMAKLEIEQLHLALQSLTDIEREVVECLYLASEPMTMTACAEKLGKPRTTVYHILESILVQLKGLLE